MKNLLNVRMSITNISKMTDGKKVLKMQSVTFYRRLFISTRIKLFILKVLK